MSEGGVFPEDAGIDQEKEARQNPLLELDNKLTAITNRNNQDPTLSNEEKLYREYSMNMVRINLRGKGRADERASRFEDYKPKAIETILSFGGREDFLAQIMGELGVPDVDTAINNWKQLVAEQPVLGRREKVSNNGIVETDLIIPTQIPGIEIRCDVGRQVFRARSPIGGWTVGYGAAIPKLTLQVSQESLGMFSSAKLPEVSEDASSSISNSERGEVARLANSYGNGMGLVRTR